jgi:MFS family permease
VTLAEPLLGTAGAGLLVSATGGSAFVGRLILARIADNVAVRRLACWVMVAQAAALLALALWPDVPVLVMASLVYGYGIGHITTLGPIVLRREFGAAAFGATYGTAASVIQLASAFGPAILGVLRDSFGDYRPGQPICLIPARWEDSPVPFVETDELGRPSSYAPWAQDEVVKVVLWERGSTPKRRRSSWTHAGRVPRDSCASTCGDFS